MPPPSAVLCGCGCFMTVVRNGVTVEEVFDDGEPYRLWDGDLFSCPSCDTEVITGFGRLPLAEHYQPTYAEQRERLAPIYRGRYDPA